MPEKLKLKLVSPAGSPAAVYSWPLQISDTHNEAIEIVETIRWVCKDFPDLQLAVDNNILSDFDPNDYESMKQLCDKYNKAITNIRKLWSGREPPPCINAPPSVPLLKHIMNQVYNHAISNPEDLNQYEPFSPEVYGETTFELVDHIIRKVNLGEDDIFLDLGSAPHVVCRFRRVGVGNVVLQVASTVNCKECIGIEKAEIPSAYAQEMEKQFLKWTAWYGKSYGDFELLKGDFLSDEFTSIISRATVIFANNYVFGPTINHQLKLKFANLPDNCRIVSSREFCPLNFRITDRNLDDIGSMMRVTQLSLPGASNCVSWTNKPINFYLHVVDRSKLEEYFRRQKYPEEYPTSSTSSPEGEQDDVSDNPLDRTFKSSVTTDDTSDEDFDAGRYSTPQGRKELELNRLSIHKKHKARLARQRKLHPIPLKRNMSIGMQKSRSVVECAKRQQKRAAKARGVQSPRRIRSHCLDDLSNTLDMFREQMISYVQDMSQPQYTETLQKTIEKEELKNKYLHMVMTNLDSEVKELSSSTVDTMKQCMAKLGMTEFTPAGLLEGAKAIVTHNRELRNNVQQLEQSVNQLQIQQFSLKQSCSDGDKRTDKTASDKTLSPLVAMDTGSCHISESSLHVESHDQSPASSLSRDLDMLTSPASNIMSPTIMSPRRGQNKSKQLTTGNSKKELEIAEILSMLGSSPTKILVAQPQRIELERPQLYSDLESCTASIESVEQEFRHCVVPQEDVVHKENTLPVKDVQKRNDISADLPLASMITLPTSLTLSLPTVLPAWSTKNDLTSSLRPWHMADKVPDKSVTESNSVQPLGVFTPRVFNNMSLAPSLVSSHHDNNFTVTSTAVGPASSTHVTSSIVDPIVPPILLSSQYAASSNPTATVTTTTTGTARSLSNKLVIGGLSNNDTSQSTTTTTSSYMPFHTVLPFSFIPSGAGVSMPDAAGSSRYVIPSINNPPMMGSNPAVMGNYPSSSTQQQQPHIRPLMLETEEDRSMLRRFQKKRNRSSTDTGSSISLDTLPQVNNPDHVVTPTRSQAGLNIELSTGRLVPAMMPTNMPSSSISNDSSVMTSQPDLTKTPLLAYPYQPNFLPYMLGRPMMPTWLDMQQKLNPTSTIRPPLYPSLMQSSQLIGFDPTGTLFKPQPQFPNLLSSPFLPAVSFGNNMDPTSLQPPVRPFIPSNPGTPTSTLSPTAYSSSMPIITKESPLLHSSFTNLSTFGGNNSSIGLNRATATPPIMTSAEVSPGRSAITGSWPFNTQVSPMLGFGLTQGKFASGSNQSSPLLGVPHTVLPVSGSPLLISQLGNLATDGGNKKDNNSPATGSQPVPDSKHSRRHYNHHQHKEQVSDKSDPKHKPGVIAFVGHNKPSVSAATNNNISNTSSPANSDCYVVPSPGTSAAATVTSGILTTNSNSPVVTSEHQLAPKPPTSVYIQNETLTPAVLPFQALVSKMMVKKPRSKKQTKTATPNKKENSPKKPGRRGRKPAATTSMSSIITPSVVEKLAGTPLLGVIAPSGLDMGDLPGNKKEVKPSKATPQYATAENTKQQQTGRSANTSDQQVPASSSSGEVNLTASDASPAKMDSACSLLSLSQSVPATSDTSNSVSIHSSPVIITDDSEVMGQVRRPSSVTAAEAMLMFTTNAVEEKSKVIEKVPSPLPVAKPNDEDISKTTEVASTEDVIVVQDEPLVVEESNHPSKKEPVCEEKDKDSSKEDCENHTAIKPPVLSPVKPPVPSSPLSHNEPTTNNNADNTVDNGVEDDVPENNQSISETSQTETLDSTATDNLDVDIPEENVSCVEASDLVSENTLASIEDIDTDDTEMIDSYSNDQAETSSDKKNDTCSDTKSDSCIDTKKDTTSSETKNDTCSDTKNDTCGDTKNDDIKNDTCSDMQDDTTVHMSQLTVTEVEISIDHADGNDSDGELAAEESTENHEIMEESEDKHQADGGDVEAQDNVVTDGRGGDKSNWEEVSDDELLDTDLTPPLAKKSKADDSEVSDKPPLTLNLSQAEDGGNNVTVSSEASTPLLDDNIVPVRQVSVSSCISLYDDAMFEGDAFETSVAQPINGDTCENGVDDSAIVSMHGDNASKLDSVSKIKHINPTIMARRKYRTQSIDSEGSSYGKESRRDSNTLTLPDSQQERNKSASPRRKLQPDSTTSPKELEADYKESLHNPIDRNEWNSRSHKSRERGRNPRNQPPLHKNYGDHYERQQGGNQRHSQNSDYRSSGRTSNTWSNSHYKHSNNNNYNNQHHSHYQQQSYPSEQDSRRGNYKRQTHHYRDSNKNNRNSGRDLSQWNKRDHHGRKQEGCDSTGYRGSSTKFQHYSQDMNTTNHHYNNRGSVVSVHSHYSQRGRHGDRSYEQVSDEEPSSTAAGFKHQPTTGMLSISEASNSAVSDNSNTGSGSDSELESNHSSASRPVSRASSVKSSSSRSNKDRVYSRKEASSSSQRNRHHPYHHSKHNSTGYNSRRH